MLNTLLIQNCNHVINKPAGKEIRLFRVQVMENNYLIVYKCAAMLKNI